MKIIEEESVKEVKVVKWAIYGCDHCKFSSHTKWVIEKHEKQCICKHNSFSFGFIEWIAEKTCADCGILLDDIDWEDILIGMASENGNQKFSKEVYNLFKKYKETI